MRRTMQVESCMWAGDYGIGPQGAIGIPVGVELQRLSMGETRRHRKERAEQENKVPERDSLAGSGGVIL